MKLLILLLLQVAVLVVLVVILCDFPAAWGPCNMLFGVREASRSPHPTREVRQWLLWAKGCLVRPAIPPLRTPLAVADCLARLGQGSEHFVPCGSLSSIGRSLFVDRHALNMRHRPDDFPALVVVSRQSPLVTPAPSGTRVRHPPIEVVVAIFKRQWPHPRRRREIGRWRKIVRNAAPELILQNCRGRGWLVLQSLEPSSGAPLFNHLQIHLLLQADRNGCGVGHLPDGRFLSTRPLPYLSAQLASYRDKMPPRCPNCVCSCDNSGQAATMGFWLQFLDFKVYRMLNRFTGRIL